MSDIQTTGVVIPLRADATEVLGGVDAAVKAIATMRDEIRQMLGDLVTDSTVAGGKIGSALSAGIIAGEKEITAAAKTEGEKRKGFSLEQEAFGVMQMERTGERQQQQIQRFGQLQSKADSENVQRSLKDAKTLGVIEQDRLNFAKAMSDSRAEYLRGQASLESALAAQTSAKILQSETERYEALAHLQQQALADDEVWTQKRGQLHSKALVDDLAYDKKYAETSGKYYADFQAGLRQMDEDRLVFQKTIAEEGARFFITQDAIVTAQHAEEVAERTLMDVRRATEADAALAQRKAQAASMLVGNGRYAGAISRAGTTGLMGFGAVAAGGIGLADMADKFNVKILEDASNMGVLGDQVDAFGQQVLALGDSVPAPLDKISEALMKAHNQGFSLADAQKLLKSTAEAALPAGADLADVTDTEAKALRELGLGVEGASSVLGVLVQAQRDSGVTLKDYSENAVPALLVSHNLGVSWVQANAALSELTHTYKDAGAAANQYQQIVRGIAEPTAKTEHAIDTVGRTRPELAAKLRDEFSRQGLEKYGVGGIAQTLAQTQQQTGLGPEQFLPGVRQIGILQLAKDQEHLNEEVARLADIYAQRVNPLAGEYARYLKTNHAQLQLMENSLIKIAESVGKTLIPEMQKGEGTIKAWLDSFDKLAPKTKQMWIDGAESVVKWGLVVSAFTAIAGKALEFGKIIKGIMAFVPPAWMLKLLGLGGGVRAAVPLVKAATGATVGEGLTGTAITTATLGEGLTGTGVAGAGILTVAGAAMAASAGIFDTPRQAKESALRRKLEREHGTVWTIDQVDAEVKRLMVLDDNRNLGKMTPLGPPAPSPFETWKILHPASVDADQRIIAEHPEAEGFYRTHVAQGATDYWREKTHPKSQAEQDADAAAAAKQQAAAQTVADIDRKRKEAHAEEVARKKLLAAQLIDLKHGVAEQDAGFPLGGSMGTQLDHGHEINLMVASRHGLELKERDAKTREQAIRIAAELFAVDQRILALKQAGLTRQEKDNAVLTAGRTALERLQVTPKGQLIPGMEPAAGAETVAAWMGDWKAHPLAPGSSEDQKKQLSGMMEGYRFRIGMAGVDISNLETEQRTLMARLAQSVKNQDLVTNRQGIVDRLQVIQQGIAERQAGVEGLRLAAPEVKDAGRGQIEETIKREAAAKSNTASALAESAWKEKVDQADLKAMLAMRGADKVLKDSYLGQVVQGVPMMINPLSTLDADGNATDSSDMMREAASVKLGGRQTRLSDQSQVYAARMDQQRLQVQEQKDRADYGAAVKKYGIDSPQAQDAGQKLAADIEALSQNTTTLASLTEAITALDEAILAFTGESTKQINAQKDAEKKAKQETKDEKKWDSSHKLLSDFGLKEKNLGGWSDTAETALESINSELVKRGANNLEQHGLIGNLAAGVAGGGSGIGGILGNAAGSALDMLPYGGFIKEGIGLIGNLFGGGQRDPNQFTWNKPVSFSQAQDVVSLPRSAAFAQAAGGGLSKQDWEGMVNKLGDRMERAIKAASGVNVNVGTLVQNMPTDVRANAAALAWHIRSENLTHPGG